MGEHPLDPIFNPRSVAFVGASNKVQTMGTAHLNTMLFDGFKGPIYPVHPTEKTVLGLKAYRTISDLPETPDLLVMLVNRDIVADLIEQAGKKGIKGAVIISGGFAEADDHGPALQAKLLELTDKYGIKVIGPNCIGVVNPWANMNVTYFPYTAKPGQIGMISHSGTYLCHVYSYLGRRECGLAQGMSLGNELNTDITDGIDYLGQSENARSIAMYIEAIRRPRKFIETARRVSAKKPIVAMYVGTSEAGARATSSHTAAMSGSGQILEGVLDQAGVIRARGMQELFDFADALAKLPPLKGTRIAVLTNSGGPGASSAEALERMGLSCPVLSEKTQEKLSAILPHTASARNPVDFTYSADMAAFYVQAPQIILEDPEIDGLIIYGLFGPGFWREMAKNAQEQMLLPDIDAITQMANYFFDALSSMPKKYDKPLVAVNFDGFADDATQEMRMRGVPVLPSPERAVAVMHALHQYHKILNRGQ